MCYKPTGLLVGHAVAYHVSITSCMIPMAGRPIVSAGMHPTASTDSLMGIDDSLEMYLPSIYLFFQNRSDPGTWMSVTSIICQAFAGLLIGACGIDNDCVFCCVVGDQVRIVIAFPRPCGIYSISNPAGVLGPRCPLTHGNRLDVHGAGEDQLYVYSAPGPASYLPQPAGSVKVRRTWAAIEFRDCVRLALVRADRLITFEKLRIFYAVSWRAQSGWALSPRDYAWTETMQKWAVQALRSSQCPITLSQFRSTINL
jgi:hypothetical protein